MKILAVGHITYDITFPIDSFPKENTKVRCHEKTECAGGPAAIAAFLLGKWGQEVMIAGLVGNDDYGKRIKMKSKRKNIINFTMKSIWITKILFK